uniref:ferroxidase n=1 Tax=Cyprinus carpio TaxID=7962 RepID=A0A8C1ULQ4_CYPCA
MKSVLSALVTAVIALQQAECLKRTYYIAIREEDWNYAPSGTNLINNRSIEQDEHASVFLSRGETRIGSVYRKALYRQYTDGSYSKEIAKPAWLGFLGPIIRAEVGDVIEVHMKNFATRPYSLHPHGVFYEKNSEGALYPDGTTGRDKRDDAVDPGKSYTYTWQVKPEYAPTEADARCLTWIYHSHGDAPKDIASGLIGALLTCKQGKDHTQQKRSDVDEDFILMFSVVDENLSWYLEENIEKFCSDPDATKQHMENLDEEFRESNLMHSINGYVYGNLPELEVCVGRPVSWHLFGIGNEVDIHSAYFHGHTLLDRMHRTDVLSLFPATFVTATMIPRTEGKWLLSCQVNDHVQAGMQSFYEVSACGSSVSSTEAPGKERHFYIAAEEMVWDYAPSGMNYMTNKSLTEPDSDSISYFSRDGGKLGGKYLKARYISYTDSTFTTKTHIAGSDDHLGILGPVIRAETGDVIIVTFFNRATRAYSIQPHGLHYEKTYEGAKYQDGKSYTKAGASVAPGEKFTYRWKAIEGPSSSDPPCLSYLYYSAADPVKDTNSGLFGPIQVCSKGVLDGSGHQVMNFIRFTIDKAGLFVLDHYLCFRGSILTLSLCAGPIIRAEVGERIQIVFKNKASKPYSVHAHGVKTSKSHQNGVQPGHTMTYSWFIPNRSGPGPSDPNCITYAYYSSVSLVEDLMSGLVGPLIVCRKNTLDTDRRRKDIDKEFALLLMVLNENESHYLDENIKTYLNTDPEKYEEKYDGDFMESNKMHGINGKMYANLHGLNMTENDKTEWYLIGLGNEVDMHTVHFHAQSFIYRTDHPHRADVYDLFPGTFQTIEMTAGSPGQWLLHCHVTDHIHAGMETLFTVHPRELISSVDRLHIALTLNDHLNQRFPNAFVRF